jgi:hypothetical protein
MNKLNEHLEQLKIQQDVKDDIAKYHSKKISLNELKERIIKHGDRFAESLENEDQTLKNMRLNISNILHEQLNCDAPSLKIMLDLDSQASIIYFFDPDDIPEETFLN